MLGSFALCIHPQLYSIALQLIFETISFKGVKLVPIPGVGLDTDRSAGENEKEARLVQTGEIHFKRLTDFESPFVSPVTDELPIHAILTFRTISSIVRHHCLI